MTMDWQLYLMRILIEFLLGPIAKLKSNSLGLLLIDFNLLEKHKREKLSKLVNKILC